MSILNDFNSSDNLRQQPIVRFNGDRKLFHQFILDIRQSLSLRKIFYVTNVTKVTLMLTAPIRPQALPNNYADQDREIQKLLKETRRDLKTKYSKDLVTYEKNIIKIEEDRIVYLGLIQSHLSPSIRSSIQRFIKDDRTTEQQIHDCVEYLHQTYGPTTIGDVLRIKAELKEATCIQGYLELLNQHDTAIAQIQMIPKRTATGQILMTTGDNPIPIYHTIDDEELRTILLAQLDPSNPYIQALKMQILSNPDTTYTQVCTQLRELSKHSDFTKHLNNTSSTTSKFNNQPSNYSHAMYASQQTPAAVNVKVCKNCKLNHHVKDCPSTTCFTCNAHFPTSKLRGQHYNQTHRDISLPNPPSLLGKNKFNSSTTQNNPHSSITDSNHNNKKLRSALQAASTTKANTQNNSKTPTSGIIYQTPRFNETPEYYSEKDSYHNQQEEDQYN